MMYLMRELKASLHPDAIHTQANPFHIAKLDASEVSKHDFPKIRGSNVTGYKELSESKIVERMIILAKNSITRKYGDDISSSNIIGGKANDEDDTLLKERIVQSPSMMVMGCNIVEVSRLHNQLI